MSQESSTTKTLDSERVGEAQDRIEEGKGIAGVDDNQKRLPWMRPFLEALSYNGVIGAACDAVGISRTTAYKHKDKNPGFSKEWDNAIDRAADRLEEEVYRRGCRGWVQNVWFQGKKVGKERKYSDNLLMFYLKGFRPDRYRDNVRVDANVRQIEKPEGFENAIADPKVLESLRQTLQTARYTRLEELEPCTN